MFHHQNIQVCLSTGMFGHTVLHCTTYNCATMELSLFGTNNKYDTFLCLYNVPTFMIIVSLCIVHRKKNWFLINPARINPYKLVYKITRLARQHKVPVQRSAFTYSEDEIPTGLDLAITKYGGLYSTEEIENAKAFYGILKFLLFLCPVFLVMIAADYSLFWYSEEMAPHYLYEQ